MIDFMTTSREAMDMYEDRLREAQKSRRASQVAAQNRGNRHGILVRSGEMLVSLGESLKRRGGVTYAYGNR